MCFLAFRHALRLLQVVPNRTAWIIFTETSAKCSVFFSTVFSCPVLRHLFRAESLQRLCSAAVKLSSVTNAIPGSVPLVCMHLCMNVCVCVCIYAWIHVACMHKWLHACFLAQGILAPYLFNSKHSFEHTLRRWSFMCVCSVQQLIEWVCFTS